MMNRRSSSPFPSNFRRPSKLGYLWFGQGRARMIEVCKSMDIRDVCECREWNAATTNDAKSKEWRIRPNSGHTGMKECVDCRCLLWPLSYVFPCDNCTEPTLAARNPVGLNEEFLCFDCQIEQLEAK